MTNNERNGISAGLLVFATATEMMMDYWLKMESYVLTGESKMLWNAMQHGVKQARHYYERFTDKYSSALFGMDNDCKRIDEIRNEAAFIARIYLTTLNLNNNGYPDENIEKALNDILSKEDKCEMFISKELIDKFRIR